MRSSIAGVVALSLAGCASIESHRAPPLDSSSEPRIGLSYFMPMRSIRITYTAPTAQSATHTIVVAPTDAYADRTRQYFLHFSRNEVSISKMNVVVTPRGLLSSAVSDVDSQLSEVLQEAARSIGAASSLLSPTGDEAPVAATSLPCIPGQAYVASFTPVSDVAGTVEICGNVRARIERMPASPVEDGKGDQEKLRSGGHGIYYRQAEAFGVVVELCAGPTCAQLHSAIVAVPNLSPTYFLPINRTLFGRNVATLTLEDGVVTGYKQDFDGEALAVAKIPFEIISAFFSGVGSFFDWTKSASDKEALYLESAADLEVRQRKTERCVAALHANDQQGITDFCQ